MLISKIDIAYSDTLKPYSYKERYILAILPFEDKTKEKKYKDLGIRIADMLISELFDYQRFRIIERGKLSTILGELKLQQTEYFQKDFTEKLGTQIGAELMLVGSILDISSYDKKRSLGIISKNTKYISVRLEARIILVKTGEIMEIAKWQGKVKSSKKRALIAVKDDKKSTNAMISEAIKKAVKELAKKIAENAPKKETASAE